MEVKYNPSYKGDIKSTIKSAVGWLSGKGGLGKN
jgi:hypothetical protein